MMSRYLSAIGSLVIFALACSLGGSDASVQEPPGEGTTSGGVPISKPTSVPPIEDTEAPVQETQPTQPPQPTVASTQSPQQELPDAGVAPIAVVDLNVIGSDDFPHLIGLVQNIGNVPLWNISITVTFYDESGNPVEDALGSALASLIPPGGISPFQVFVPRDVPTTVESVTTLIEWSEAGPDHPWTMDGIDVSGTTGAMSEGNFEISGSLTNTTGKTAELINLIPIAYNADGKLIGFSVGNVQDLAAGASTSFTVSIGDSARAEPTVDHFDLVVVVNYED